MLSVCASAVAQRSKPWFRRLILPVMMSATFSGVIAGPALAQDFSDGPIDLAISFHSIFVADPGDDGIFDSSRHVWTETTTLNSNVVSDVETCYNSNDVPDDCEAPGEIMRFRVRCTGGGELQALAETFLPQGTLLTFTNTNDVSQIVPVNGAGKAQAIWTGQAGMPVICVAECDGICRPVSCP